MKPGDLGPEVCNRGPRNEDQDPEGHGPCERCECPRFEVLRTENLSGDRWPRRPRWTCFSALDPSQRPWGVIP